MYIVYNMTNYGYGIYFAGAYRSLERAEKRLAWCKKHLANDENCDSWNIQYVKAMPITSKVEGL